MGESWISVEGRSFIRRFVVSWLTHDGDVLFFTELFSRSSVLTHRDGITLTLKMEMHVLLLGFLAAGWVSWRGQTCCRRAAGSRREAQRCAQETKAVERFNIVTYCLVLSLALTYDSCSVCKACRSSGWRSSKKNILHTLLSLLSVHGTVLHTAAVWQHRSYCTRVQ